MQSIPNIRFYAKRFTSESTPESTEDVSGFERLFSLASYFIKSIRHLDESSQDSIDKAYNVAKEMDAVWAEETANQPIKNERLNRFFNDVHLSLRRCGDDRKRFCSFFRSQIYSPELRVEIEGGLYRARRSISYARDFQNDYDRIVSSSAFRRLQDKAQVFSLESFDFVRTRLTHSNEVSAISEQLVAKMMFHSLMLNQNLRLPLLLSDAAKCACLLHDIGNPPFGHYGESIMRRFFKGVFSKESSFSISDAVAKLIGTENKKVDDVIKDPQMINDFELFDGNAQAFRIVNHLQPYRNKTSLNLTASILRGLLKYPCNSRNSIEDGKFGYFYSETEIIDFLKENADYSDGTMYLPALIMEVADDIAYIISDFEDSLKKRLGHL